MGRLLAVGKIDLSVGAVTEVLQPISVISELQKVKTGNQDR